MTGEVRLPLTSDEAILNHIFPQYEEDSIKELIFNLGYMQYGYGLGWKPQDILSLPLLDAVWYAERQEKENRRHSRTNKRAAEGK